VPRHGLRAPFRGRTVRDLAQDVLEIARAGLKGRARYDRWGDDESHFIETLALIAESGRSPADELLERYQGSWEGSVDPVYREYAY
jgi:glutamate--cysteine ligase